MASESGNYTGNYRTKTNFMERNNGQISGAWEVAIDVGYSAVKVFSPNIVARFPSYAKRMGETVQFAWGYPENSILYRDNDTGMVWIIGEKAQELMSDTDTSDSEASLYGRERYFNDIFRVVTRAGLGVAMMDNKFGTPEGQKIVVQTGLPDKYMGDEQYLKDAMSGHHRFTLKVGKNDWKEYDFTLDPKDVYVMSQPKGTLFSNCIDRDGKFHRDARTLLSSSVIVFDPGFGTLDIFPIMAGVVGHGETFPDLGMKRILQETTQKIKEKFGIDIPVPAMQKYLATGVVRYVDRKKMTSRDYPFADLLKSSSEEICEEAINRMCSVLNLGEFDYLIVTGGTGAAWFNMIRDRFKEFTTLKILQGNQNDNLPFVYSNARGYYFYRYNKLAGEMKKA